MNINLDVVELGCLVFDSGTVLIMNSLCNRSQLLEKLVFFAKRPPLHSWNNPVNVVAGGDVLVEIRFSSNKGNTLIVFETSPLGCSIFTTHINVGFVILFVSIKCICKYVNKRSDMTVFVVKSTSRITYEIDQYRLERYITSNE